MGSISPPNVDPNSEALLTFWFSSSVRDHWFQSTPDLDAQIKARFEALWIDAAEGRLQHWAQTPRGALALVILLDQLPLNMYRGEARSFSTEARAREVGARAIDSGFDEPLSDEQRAFLYMPFMHSENLADQDRAVALYEAAGLRDSLKWVRHHRDLIRRFGRFPHRNRILGRPSTTDELDYLASKEAFHG